MWFGKRERGFEGGCGQLISLGHRTRPFQSESPSTTDTWWRIFFSPSFSRQDYFGGTLLSYRTRTKIWAHEKVAKEPWDVVLWPWPCTGCDQAWVLRVENELCHINSVRNACNSSYEGQRLMQKAWDPEKLNRAKHEESREVLYFWISMNYPNS